MDKKFSIDVERGILISNGEFFVCNGNFNWLGDVFDVFIVVIYMSQGLVVVFVYFNCV